MPRLEVGWETPRCLRNDLEAARYSIDRANIGLELFAIEAFDKPHRHIDVIQDITERRLRDQKA